MKKLFSSLFLLIYFVGVTNVVLAQNNLSSNSKNPNAHEVHKNIRESMRQIQKDLKAGKITEAQANTRRDNLRATHQKEKQFRHQNGGKDLTSSQKKQLTDSLSQNGSAK